MKLTLLATALMAILGLTLNSVPVHADDTAPATSADTSTKAMKTPFKGAITAVGSDSVTIQGAKESMTLKITPSTKFKGGSALTDFAVGDKVTGSYTKDEAGNMTANSLHKKGAKGAGAAAAPAAQ